MKNKYNEETCGSVSFSALIVLLFLSAVVIGISLFIRSAAVPVLALSEELKHKEEAQDILSAVIAEMQIDQTPTADSAFDAWYMNIENIASKYKAVVSVSPVSDDVNPNFATIEFLRYPNVTSALSISGTDFDSFKQYRIDNGISMNITDHYSDFFDSQNLFSPYGWINVNNTDTAVADMVFNEVTGSSCAALLKSKRAKEEIITDISELEQSTGGASKILTTASQFNVNFIDEDVLLGILLYIGSFTNEQRKLKNPQQAAQLITAAREHGEILPHQLQDILQVPAHPHPVFSYLGTQTWFWEISIVKHATTLTAVLCKFPASTNPLYSAYNTQSIKNDFISPVSEGTNKPVEIKSNKDGNSIYKILSMRYEK